MLRDNCMSTHLLSESKAPMLVIISTLPANTSLQQPKKLSLEDGMQEAWTCFYYYFNSFYGKAMWFQEIIKKKFLNNPWHFAKRVNNTQPERHQHSGSSSILCSWRYSNWKSVPILSIKYEKSYFDLIFHSCKVPCSLPRRILFRYVLGCRRAETAKVALSKSIWRYSSAKTVRNSVSVATPTNLQACHPFTNGKAG